MKFYENRNNYGFHKKRKKILIQSIFCIPKFNIVYEKSNGQNKESWIKCHKKISNELSQFI